jgi:hypothetical protein
MKKCALFFASIAMREPGGSPRLLRCAAMRRDESSTWPQV